MTNKIIKPFEQSIEKLDENLANAKKKTEIIGLCHGCFDLIHDGHIRHFEEVSSLCDVLIVSITNDENINKGPGRPVFNQDERANLLAAIRYIDYVLIINSPTGIEVIDYVKPDLYFKGIDYLNFKDDLTGNMEKEVKAVEKHGGRVHVTETEKKSSTSIINSANLQTLDSSVHDFTNRIREKDLAEEIDHYIHDVFPKLKVSVFGDLIIDEYTYTTPVGTTTKSPAISVIYQNKEVMLGGSSAIARHLDSFAGEVNLFFEKGKLNWAFDELLENEASSTLKLISVDEDEKYTPHKVRYFSSGYPNTLLDSISGKNNSSPQKLFEMGYLSNELLSEHLNHTIKTNKKLLESQDLIAWTDFGHGFLSPEAFELIRDIGPGIIVNAQTNSSNYGFNLATKYIGAKYFCIDELEARLLVSDRRMPFEELWSEVFSLLKPQELFITRGAKGLCFGNSGNNYSRVPALATEIVDAVGAGDAVFSAALLCQAANVRDEIKEVLLPSFGAIACSIVGNSEPVSKAMVEKYIKGWI